MALKSKGESCTSCPLPWPSLVYRRWEDELLGVIKHTGNKKSASLILFCCMEWPAKGHTHSEHASTHQTLKRTKTHTCTYTQTNKHTHISSHKYKHAQVQTRKHQTNTHTHTHTQTHTQRNTNTHTQTETHAQTYCAYTHIQTHIHTNRYIHTQGCLGPLSVWSCLPDYHNAKCKVRVFIMALPWGRGRHHSVPP